MPRYTTVTARTEHPSRCARNQSDGKVGGKLPTQPSAKRLSVFLSPAAAAAVASLLNQSWELQEVQEPMMQATEGMGNNNTNDGGSSTATPAANPSAGPNTSALPNPWAAAG